MSQCDLHQLQCLVRSIPWQQQLPSTWTSRCDVVKRALDLFSLRLVHRGAQALQHRCLDPFQLAPGVAALHARDNAKTGTLHIAPCDAGKGEGRAPAAVPLQTAPAPSAHQPYPGSATGRPASAEGLQLSRPGDVSAARSLYIDDQTRCCSEQLSAVVT